ncbi:hypothetical protein [Candidatus Enterococcus mangumiae]|uniref:Uncharacterized protein n=1 Tax=Candidatus Enterococcus mangumiae TaxID=2230878 RepID=A0ABZ2SVS8_9ENTE|nr:hypothetical protein [Enterococcus sp. DIV1094]MBO0489161.1 hypothetical protein [Enterococcus sp. DIV1094]
MLQGTNQKIILCFGVDESNLEQQLDDRELRKKTNPYDPLVYTEELVDHLIQQPFENFTLQSKELIDQIKEVSNYPLWEDIQAIMIDDPRFQLHRIYSEQFLEEYQQYKETEQFANHPLKNTLMYSLRMQLLKNTELLMIEVAKKRSDLVIWMPLDSYCGNFSATIEGKQNGYTDFTLRSLYHEKDKLKASIVFWENGQIVPAPWERGRNARLWRSCVENDWRKSSNISTSERNLLIYGLRVARIHFNYEDQVLLKHFNYKEINDFNIDKYNDILMESIFEQLKHCPTEKSREEFFSNWIYYIPEKDRYLPLWETYYRVTKTIEKFQLKNIFKKVISEDYTQFDCPEIRQHFIKKGCKIGLELTLLTGNITIIFLRDELCDLRVVKKVSSITGSELRYMYRNWERFKHQVVFIENKKFVPPPWEDDTKLWATYKPKSRSATQKEACTPKDKKDFKQIKGYAQTTIRSQSKQRISVKEHCR